MSSDQLFNISNKLKNYSVLIDDIDLIKETIISVETSYKNDSPVVKGRVVFSDLYDMNLLKTWRDVEVTLSYIDIFDNKILKNFVILSVTEQYTENNKKLLVLDLQDKFSYVLSRSFLSKGFKTNPIAAIQSYIEHLEINNLSNLTTDFSTYNKNYNFTVPKNINNLDFFIIELNKLGYSFYQTKTSVAIKSLTDLLPSNLPSNGLFLNETDNQLYKNKIIDIKSSLNNRDDILPARRTLGFNFDTKDTVYSVDNEVSNLSLNSDVFTLQDGHGFQDVINQQTTFDNHTLLLKESFLKQASVQIVVNGYGNNDLNQIYELKLRGNQSTSDSQSKGNLVMNGFYISKAVTDKIIGDSLIQQIQLQRSDLIVRE